MDKVFLYFIVLGISWDRASSIDCWVCTSSDAGCGETIDSEVLQDNYKTASGCEGCGKSFKSLGTIWSVVERTCLTVASDTCDNKLGYGECTCSTTFCNGQDTIVVKPVLMVLTVFLAFILKTFMN